MTSSLWRSCTLLAQSGANELRAASGPRCAGAGDGAGGSAVVGLGPDAGLIAAWQPLCPPHPSPLNQVAVGKDWTIIAKAALQSCIRIQMLT